MGAILPRQRTCVLCGDAILGAGRIDRLYCSANCRNLAWRFRTGKRAGKPKTAAPVEASQRRGALLRRAWGLQGEVAAARRWIGDLEAQRAKSQKRATTENKQLADMRAELDRERADRATEHARHCAELAAALDRAAACEAELKRVCIQLLADRERTAACEAELKRMRAELAAGQQLAFSFAPSAHPSQAGPHNPSRQDVEAVASLVRIQEVLSPPAARPLVPPRAVAAAPSEGSGSSVETAPMPPTSVSQAPSLPRPRPTVEVPPPTISAPADKPPAKESPRGGSWFAKARNKLAEWAAPPKNGKHLLD